MYGCVCVRGRVCMRVCVGARVCDFSPLQSDAFNPYMYILMTL